MAGNGETPKGLFGEHGWFAESYDKQDQLFKAREDIVAKPSENLRENKKYAGFWGDIYDQGKLNSCVANAAAALLLFEMNKEQAISKTTTPQAFNPSRTFIWYNARVIEKVKKETFDNATCHTRNAMKSLEVYGVCNDSECPYPDSKFEKTPAVEESSKRPSGKAYTAAEGYRIAKYERLDKKRSPAEKNTMASWKPEDVVKAKDEDGNNLKDNLCKAITEGYPVQFGFHYYKERFVDNFVEVMNHPSAKWSLTTLSTKHEKPRGRYGSHAVLAIGYDRDSVICQNSWGQSSDDKAIFLAPWAWITDFEATEDFWVIRGFRNLVNVSTSG